MLKFLLDRVFGKSLSSGHVRSLRFASSVLNFGFIVLRLRMKDMLLLLQGPCGARFCTVVCLLFVLHDLITC